MLVQLSGGFDRTLQKFTLAVLPFRRIKKINLTLKLQLQSLHWSFRFINISPFPPCKSRFRNTTKLYFCSTRVLESSLPLHGRPNILLVNLWQHQCWCKHTGITGLKWAVFKIPGVTLPFFSTPSPFFYLRHFSCGLWLLFLVLYSETTWKRLIRRLDVY